MRSLMPINAIIIIALKYFILNLIALKYVILQSKDF